MGLPWVRLDTSMPDNPKILGLLTTKEGHRAAFVWVCALAYSGKHETAGFIAREAVSRINGRSADMARLVSQDLLVECAGGWDIKGWDEFQITSDEMRRRSEKGKRMAAARWSKAQTEGGK